MASVLLSSLLLVASFANVQCASSGGATATPSSVVSVSASASASSTGAPCAQISASLASYAAASPSATQRLFLDPQLAYNCANSAPIVRNDALQVVDGLSAFFEFQSDLAYLKSPPSTYPFPALDLLAELATLRSHVQQGAFSSELAFQTSLANIIARAHDGHLGFSSDIGNVFLYYRGFGPLVSLSTDGEALPKLYSYYDFRSLSSNSSLANLSSIVSIDGANATQWLEQVSVNSTYSNYEDLDALYNLFVFSINNGEGGVAPGYFYGSPDYAGPSTNVTFSNGTTRNYPNHALTSYDFTGVTDGASFYYEFCNATAKEVSLSSLATGTVAATLTPSATASAVTRLPNYPSPVAISSDGGVAGYFFNMTGYESVAVIALTVMSETAYTSFQSTLTQILNLCRAQNKTHLVLDVTGNPGGDIGLGYDTFKQLFPTIDPYGAGNFRAHEAFNILGNFFTNYSEEVRERLPNNDTAFTYGGGYTEFAAESVNNDSGHVFGSWAQLYGPVEVQGDNFTNLVRIPVANQSIDINTEGIVISGYGNLSNGGPQPFKPENMIILSNGQCGSTCSILGHLLKWQGKVKSIAIGGRPEARAMQTIGGIKGSEVFSLSTLGTYLSSAVSYADDLGVDLIGDNAVLQTLYNLTDYVLLRSSDPSSMSTVTLNLKNNIAEGDRSYTPLQFTREDADCRLWYQAQHVADVTTLWATVANQAFGLDGTRPYSLCVSGSTNSSTSLSGNSTLYNNGVPTNVTDFTPQVNGSSSGSTTSSSSDAQRHGGSIALAVLVAAIALAV